MHTEAHLFSVPNDCLWYDKLWGPSQRVVTLFLVRSLKKQPLQSQHTAPSDLLVNCGALLDLLVLLPQLLHTLLHKVMEI